MINFNEIEWHDVAIEKIEIDRKNPGNEDKIQILLSNYEEEKIKLEFLDVYQSCMNLNFGVIPVEGKETIDYAFQEGKENEMVSNFYKLWKGAFDSITLNYYEIVTNSTGSKIQIVARDFSYELL